MRKSIVRGIGAALFAIGLCAGQARSQPPYGPLIDEFCTANGRTPATPFADGKSSTPLTECQLCHMPNTFNKRDVVEPNFTQFQLARVSGDYSFFCPPAQNQPPVLAPIGPQSAAVGVPLVIALSATDPERSALKFSASNTPSGATLMDHADGTAEFRWLPGDTQAGNHSVTFTVTDSGSPLASDSEQVAITVGPGNRPPVLAPIGNRSFSPGTPLAIDLSATDPDRDRIAFSVTGAPLDSALVDRGDGTAQWTWLPPAGTASSYELVFGASDGATPPATDSETVVLSPEGLNRPPVLGMIGNQRVRVGQTLSLDITATDPDRDALAFSATGLPANASFTDLGDGSAQLRFTPTADQVGSVSLVVAVADDAMPAEVDSETFSISVEAAPVASGQLVVTRALWNARRSLLFAAGSGAAPGETLSLVDPETQAVLGVGRADASGAFRLLSAPFIAPCEVGVRSLDAQSAALAVSGAPQDCGELLLTKLREVRWNCERQELRVRAERAPASGILDVIDPASGALLGSIPADHRGRVDGRLMLSSAPLSVSLSARSGEAAFELGSFEVEDAAKLCSPELEDEDGDEIEVEAPRSEATTRRSLSGPLERERD